MNIRKTAIVSALAIAFAAPVAAQSVYMIDASNGYLGDIVQTSDGVTVGKVSETFSNGIGSRVKVKLDKQMGFSRNVVYFDMTDTGDANRTLMLGQSEAQLRAQIDNASPQKGQFQRALKPVTNSSIIGHTVIDSNGMVVGKVRSVLGGEDGDVRLVADLAPNFPQKEMYLSGGFSRVGTDTVQLPYSAQSLTALISAQDATE